MRLNHRIFSFFAALAVTFSCSVVAVAQADDDPINKDDDFNKAISAYSYFSCDTALAYFNKAIVKFPKSARGYNWLGYVQNSRNEFESAVSYFNRAIELAKRDESEQKSILYGRSEAFAELGQYIEAKVDIDKVITLDPKDAKCYALRAVFCELLDWPMQALDDYRKAIGVDPSKGSYYAYKAMTLLKLGRAEEALTLLDNGKSLVTSSDQLLSARANVNIELKKYSEAMSDAITAYRGIGGLPWSTILYLADAAPSNYKWALRSKLRTDASNPQWQELSGTVSSLYGRYAEASENFLKAVQLENGVNVASDLRYYAENQKNMLNFRRAKSVLQMLCDADTSDTNSLANLAEVKLQIGEDAKSDIERLASNKNADEGLLFLCVRNDDVDMMHKALDVSERCIHEASDVYALLSIYSMRARLHLKLGEAAAAEDDARKCLELYRRIGLRYVSDNRIQGMYRFCHRTALAVLKSEGEEVDKLLASDLAGKTDRADAFYNAACVRARQGRKDESIALLDSAFQHGFFNVSYLKGDPLLASVSDDPRVAKLIEARNKRVAQVAEAEPQKVIKEIPCSFENSCPKMTGSANGLKLDISVNTDISSPTISKVEADFMNKNGYLANSDYYIWDKYAIIKELHVGDIVLTNVKASVVEQESAFEIDKYTLLRVGALSVDKVNKKITLTGVAY